jgi:hypothetical protein
MITARRSPRGRPARISAWATSPQSPGFALCGLGRLTAPPAQETRTGTTLPSAGPGFGVFGPLPGGRGSWWTIPSHRITANWNILHSGWNSAGLQSRSGVPAPGGRQGEGLTCAFNAAFTGTGMGPTQQFPETIPCSPLPWPRSGVIWEKILLRNLAVQSNATCDLGCQIQFLGWFSI